MCVHIYHDQQRGKLAPPDLYVKTILKAQLNDNCVRVLTAMLSHVLNPVPRGVVERHPKRNK